MVKSRDLRGVGGGGGRKVEAIKRKGVHMSD